MPVHTAALPLPFDDACIVIEGRIADARLRVKHAEGGDPGRHLSRTWVLSTGAASVLPGGIIIPALPATVVVRLASRTVGGCEVTVVNDGLAAVAVLDLLLVDLGPGRRADAILEARAPAWTA